MKDNSLQGVAPIILVLLVVIFLMQGDPDLWDKLLEVSHAWVDGVTVSSGGN